MKNILLALLVSTSIFADSLDKDNLDNLSLEELMDIKIYSATKSYQRIEEIPANIIVITRKDIEKFNYTTLDELLKNIPGLFVLDDTEHFQIGARGSLGSSFKLMINNNPISPLRITNGGTSNRNFFSTPVEAIDRIEITKGSQAVTYGSNSMYGSINIITNDFNEKNIVSLGKGNNGQDKVFLRLNHASENGGFTLNTSFFNTDGLNGDLKDTLKASDYTSRNASAVESVDERLEQRYKTLDFSNRYKNLTTDITYSKTNYGFYIEPTYENTNQVEQTEKAIALTYEDEIGKDLSYKLNYIHSQKNYDIDKLSFSSPSHTGDNYDLTKRDQVDMHLNYSLNKKLKFLLGASYEEIDNSLIYNYNDTKRHSIYKFKTKDLYTKLQYKITQQFEFNAGLRYTTRGKFDLKGEEDNTTTVGIEKPFYVLKSYDKKINYLPQISMTYHLNTNNHIKLLYGKANQLSYQSVEDNFEEIENTELNYIYFSKIYHINTSLFYNKSKNISPFVHQSNTPASSTNSELENSGLEFALTYKPDYNFQTSGSFTYQKTKNLKDDSALTPGFSPDFLAKLSMTYTNEKTNYSMWVNYISPMKAALNSTTKERYGEDSPHNVTLNANIKHKLKKDISLNLHATNILNRDNRIPAGATLSKLYYGGFTKGRLVLLTLNYKF